MDNYKTCPFCKKSILKSSSVCPNCTRVLIETITTQRTENPEILTQKPQEKKQYHFFEYLKNLRSKIPINISIIPIIFFLLLVFSQLNSSKTPMPQETCLENGKNYNSLSNGTVIHSLPYDKNNLGELKIENGSQYDAIAKLVNSLTNTSVYSVYIAAGSNYSIKQIPDGKFQLLFSLGKDWDLSNNKFKSCKTFARFDDSFIFTTTRQFYGLEYSTFRVTLNPVVGGTAKTNEIVETEFDKY